MENTLKFLFKHPYFTSSLGVSAFVAGKVALEWAPTNQIATEYTLPLGLMAFAGMFVLEKTTTAIARLIFLSRNKFAPDDNLACTEHAERVLSQGKQLGLQGEAHEVFSGWEPRDIDTSHTVVKFGQRVVNQQKGSHHGELNSRSLNVLRKRGLVEKNEEIKQ